MGLYKKTSEPPVSPGVIARPRVDALLEAGIQSPVIVVSAGAGFGKTQAVAGFLERSSYRGVWQQLTPLDNLPMRFWESFTHTVSLHRPALAGKLEALGFPDSLYKFHRFLQFFTEALYIDNQFVVLVFDDFHLLTEPPLVGFFDRLISAKLENICMIFISRTLELPYSYEPPYVLTTDDLRFTAEETKLYFEERGIKPSNGCGPEELFRYTNGWPIALYFAERQMMNGDTASAQRRVDSKKILFKLIDREIFSHYTEGERQFFALLPSLVSLPKGLLGAVFPDERAIRLLEENIFTSYDRKDESYYIHRLFLDFLEEKRDMIDGEALNTALRKAGDWCRENRRFIDAISYYEQCGGKDSIVNLILGFKGLRHARGDANRLIRYIENFPEGFMRQNVMCRIVYAMFFLNNLEIEKAQAQMDIVQSQLAKEKNTPENTRLKGEASIGKGLIRMALGDSRFAELFREADKLLPDGSGHWGENLNLIEYGNALNISSPEAGAVDGRVRLMLESMPCISRIFHGAGYGMEHLASAESCFLRCRFREAQDGAYKAMYMAEEKNRCDVIDNALFLLLRIFLLTGNVSKIRDITEKLQKNSQHGGLQSVSDVALGWFFSEIGETKKAADWIIYDEEASRPPISLNKDVLVHIRCLIEKKDYYNALALAERLETVFSKRGEIISMIYVYVYRAVVFYSLDDTDKAWMSLIQAYDLSHNNGILSPFIEFGHKTRPVLGYFRSNGHEAIPPDWLSEVHTKASTYAKRRAYIVSHFRNLTGGKSEDFGLTDREIELLQNMSQGLTREETAASMYVSPHTVKSMLKMIYSKIGAVNAADAIRIAGGAELIL